MAESRRLPGIRIDTAPPPPTEALPRMDVAVFIGFASTGPVHRPVAVESVAHFGRVFGEDLALAFDGERGERIFANLGPAVRAFFSNGGRRCWVVRVARTPALEAAWRGLAEDRISRQDCARANRFTLPGVLALSGDGGRLAPAEAQARSVGAWSDALRVSSALSTAGFQLKDPRPSTASPDTRFHFGTTTPLQAGDLIVLEDPGGSGTGQRRIYAIINSIGTAGSAGTTLREVDATLCAAFAPVAPNLSAPSPALSGTATVGSVNTGEGEAAFEPGTAQAPNPRVSFTLEKSSVPEAGLWVRWHDSQQAIWLLIDHLVYSPSQTNPDMRDCVAEGPAWRESLPMLPDPLPGQGFALSLELQAVSGQNCRFAVNGIGLTPSHRAAWWLRLSDDLLYAASADASKPQDISSTDSPESRFPLAALDSETGQSPPLAWIPLGVTAGYGAAPGRVPMPASVLERDGLSRFNAELFLDPNLADLGSASLLEHANTIHCLSDRPRQLYGIHTVLLIGIAGLYNEASLIAVPDALHLGWTKRPLASPPTLQPDLRGSPAHWSAHRGPCAVAPGKEALEAPDFGQFLDYSTRQLATPSLSGPSLAVPRGVFRLTWQSPETGVTYVLEEAQSPDFNSAREAYRGGALTCDVAATREGVFFYRVTAFAAGEQSVASNSVAVIIRDEEWLSLPSADYENHGAEELLRIQREMLRLAAATGELLAVLGMPRHYRAPEAVRHAARLKAPRGGDTQAPGDFGRALSYGALYHPWIVSAAPSTQNARPGTPIAQCSCPPEGVVTGMLAARASLRGAWIAPANQALREVVALTPAIEEDARLSLHEAQVNLLIADPRGFLTLSADTLADKPELLPINVRRLLILLRRLALRRGASYVFEPNDEILRRAVERGFTLMLADLFKRGAFAGDSAAESFRVVTASPVNTNADRDAGRLFVELRVAPAWPLQFLNVRLVQSGERFTVLEEV